MPDHPHLNLPHKTGAPPKVSYRRYSTGITGIDLLIVARQVEALRSYCTELGLQPLVTPDDFERANSTRDRATAYVE